MAAPGAAEQLRSLVDQHYVFLYRYAYRLTGSVQDAEDLTQETYCTAQQKLHQLRDWTKARGWLCRILRSHYLVRCRKPSLYTLESCEELADDSAEAVPEHVDGEQLQRALAELPEPYRTPVILFYFEEMSYRQIAEVLEVPLGTVMSRLARGKQFLRWRLQMVQGGRPVPQPSSDR